MMDFLAHSPLLFVVGSKSVSLVTPTAGELDTCFLQMRGWLQLQWRTVKAEFPSCEFWMSFEIFSGSVKNMIDAVLDERCERLAASIKEDKRQLANEVNTWNHSRSWRGT